jgi:hypothetical protein
MGPIFDTPPREATNSAEAFMAKTKGGNKEGDRQE